MITSANTYYAWCRQTELFPTYKVSYCTDYICQALFDQLTSCCQNSGILEHKWFPYLFVIFQAIWNGHVFYYISIILSETLLTVWVLYNTLHASRSVKVLFVRAKIGLLFSLDKEYFLNLEQSGVSYFLFLILKSYILSSFLNFVSIFLATGAL